MLGIFYLLICLFFGVQLIRLMLPDTRRLYVGIAVQPSILEKVPSYLFIIPAGLTVGLIIVTAFTYFLALIIHPFTPKEMHVLHLTNIISICFFGYLGSLFWQKVFVRNRQNSALDNSENQYTKKPLPFSVSVSSILIYGCSILIMVAACVYLAFYTFNIQDTLLQVAPSVASDFAPNLALASSFSKGSNFPTQYPHFPGDKIQYHFLFFFMCGNLNFLGLPMDLSFNIPSILVMLSAMTLLGILAVLITGRRASFLFLPILILFRSGLNIFYQFRSLLSVPGTGISGAVRGILRANEWYVLTDKDDWGLWAINVYANQRHLMLGVSFLLVIVFFYIPHVRRLFLQLSKSKGIINKLRTFAFSRHAWLPRSKDPLHPYRLMIVSIILVMAVPYFHGSALISTMLILLGMALLSESRLLYLPVALSAVASALLQTMLFSGGTSNVVSFALNPGFIVSGGLWDILKYIIKIGGPAVIILPLLTLGLFIYAIVRNQNKYRFALLFAFSMPLVFGFIFQVSQEMLANHKFIHVSFLFYYVIVSGFLAHLLTIPLYRKLKNASETHAQISVKKGIYAPIAVCIATRFLAALIAFVLFAGLIGTGISEWAVFHNRNRSKIELNMDSQMVQTIISETAPDAVFLTPPWYIHTFFLSGRMSYYGHPYYAWSAGHDTQSRLHTFEWLLTGCGGDIELFRHTCAQEGIDYVLFIPELYAYLDANGEPLYNAEFFATHLTPVASFPNEYGIIIYRI